MPSRGPGGGATAGLNQGCNLRTLRTEVEWRTGVDFCPEHHPEWYQPEWLTHEAPPEWRPRRGTLWLPECGVGTSEWTQQGVRDSGEGISLIATVA